MGKELFRERPCGTERAACIQRVERLIHCSRCVILQKAWGGRTAGIHTPVGDPRSEDGHGLNVRNSLGEVQLRNWSPASVEGPLIP